MRSLGLNNMSKPKSYGKCRKCGGAIAIPGLDASLCAEFCGWVQAKVCFDNLAKETKKTRKKANSN